MQVLFGPLFLLLVVNVGRFRGELLFRNVLGDIKRCNSIPSASTKCRSPSNTTSANSNTPLVGDTARAAAVCATTTARQRERTAKYARGDTPRAKSCTPGTISPRAASLRLALLGSVGAGLAVLSVSNHQEARFLLPATLGTGNDPISRFCIRRR